MSKLNILHLLSYSKKYVVTLLHRCTTHYKQRHRIGFLPKDLSKNTFESYEKIKLYDLKNELRRSESRFNILVSQIAECVWETDAEGYYTYISPQIFNILGYRPEKILGMRTFELMSEQEKNHIIPVFKEISNNRNSFDQISWTCLHKEGNPVFLKSSGSPKYSNNGLFIGFQGITNEVHIQEHLKLEIENHEQFKNLFEQCADGIMVLDSEGNVLEANEGALLNLNRSREQLMGQPFGVPLVGDEVTEIDILNKDGKVKNISMHYADFTWYNNPAFMVTLYDFTQRRKREEELMEIAQHDSLTGLPNRLLLLDRLFQATALTRRANTLLAVCYIDLDGFKEVNDFFGHAGGDIILIEATKRMQAVLRAGDTAARIGGDEFVVLIGGLKSKENCDVAIKRVGDAIAAPYDIDGQEHNGISASIGVTIYPVDNSTPATLINHSDQAMYSAKQAGKKCIRFYNKNLQ
ncbi:diguanylate cyclase [Desulforhopalus vacuolatus]|uniref:sensor domain-containing protein n=1 Tax=Desulforhopalus vacuolatus TaxID=40414 RepID=UPI001963D68C|nr:diguanylate cyclase [Desulforhopalus vacuolatus]MBM9519393.1 diguanylate cyclase [Desulforhopalus vacuolatus]